MLARILHTRAHTLAQGERPFARDNKLIGRFLLDNLECDQRGEEVRL